MIVALVGDSILDNAAYVRGGRDVTAHLRALLPDSSEVHLLARDGSRIEQIESQLTRLPERATHIVVSAGGNDAIDVLDVFPKRVANVADALRVLADAQSSFRFRYHRLLERLGAIGCSVVVCTIYEPDFTDEGLRKAALAGLSLFNDVIVREAANARIPILDLRSVCTEPTDFANPIEPSDRGGRKIAQAIVRFMLGESWLDNGVSIHW